MRITAITPMKNEGPFILEWVAYHRLIGINDFIVFTNDCTDGTDLILERLDELGIVRHLPNPSVVGRIEGGHHWAAMAYINAFPRLRRSDWFVSFDVDEFICVNAGAGRMEDLFAALPDADLIAINQLNFGCAGHEHYDPRQLLTERFDRAMARDNGPYGWVRARGVKTITRGTAPLKWIGNHSPDVAEDHVGKVRWVNAAGEAVPEKTYTTPFKSAKGGLESYEHVQLNHYALRTMENFLVKTERGDANREVEEELKYWRQYWNKYDDNVAHDTRIQRWLPDLRAAVADLRKDPELAALHDAAVTWHQAAIARLRDTHPQKALLNRIRGMHGRKLEKEIALLQEPGAPPAKEV